MGTIKTKGSIFVDEGAARAIINGKSLLPVGILDTNGTFQRGDTVSIFGAPKKKLGIGVTSYSNSDIKKIKKNKPPIQCDEDLQIINVGSKILTLVKIVNPVVVKPDTASKNESTNVN